MLILLCECNTCSLIFSAFYKKMLLNVFIYFLFTTEMHALKLLEICRNCKFSRNQNILKGQNCYENWNENIDWKLFLIEKKYNNF